MTDPHIVIAILMAATSLSMIALMLYNTTKRFFK